MKENGSKGLLVGIWTLSSILVSYHVTYHITVLNQTWTTLVLMSSESWTTPEESFALFALPWTDISMNNSMSTQILFSFESLVRWKLVNEHKTLFTWRQLVHLYGNLSSLEWAAECLISDAAVGNRRRHFRQVCNWNIFMFTRTIKLWWDERYEHC